MSNEAMKRLTRDDTEHGIEYYRADEVDAMLAAAPQPAPAITPEHLLALAQTASLELDKVIEAFKMAEQREVKDVVIDNMGDPFIAKAYVTPQPAQQEPVAWLKTIETPGGFGKFVEAKPNEKGAKPVYLSPPAAPVQEPVAHRDGFWCVDLTCKKCYGADFRFKNTPPPAQRTWVGLTPKEVRAIFQEMFDAQEDWATFASALQAKLKEKNT